VDEPRELDAGDVARLAVDALEVPARLRRLGVVVREEAAAVVLVERAREAPGLERAEVEDLDLEQIAGLRRLDGDGPREVVDLRADARRGVADRVEAWRTRIDRVEGERSRVERSRTRRDPVTRRGLGERLD
jgi:hypothetical protein